jgi:hypothetical protein
VGRLPNNRERRLHIREFGVLYVRVLSRLSDMWSAPDSITFTSEEQDRTTSYAHDGSADIRQLIS